MNKFEVGMKAAIEKIFSQAEVDFYCQRISLDNNSVHSSKEAAIRQGFQDCIVPGIMVTSIFGGLLGSTLPGEGTIHLGQTAKFIKPVYVGEKIRAVIEISHIRPDKPIMTFSTTVYKENGEVAIEGEAVVKYL